MKLFKITLPGFSMMVILGMILLVTCKPKTDETPQPLYAFDTTDISSVDSFPAIFKDTSKAFIRTRFTRVNPSFFKAEKNLNRDSILTLQLFPDVTIRLFIESIVPGDDSTEVWTLRPEGPRYGTATIITSPSGVYARIQIHATIYEVFPVGKNRVRIREIDQTRFPAEGLPIEKTSRKVPQVDNRQGTENPVITVLLVGPTVYSIYCLDPSMKKIVESTFTYNLSSVFNSAGSTGVSAVVKFECVDYLSVGGDLEKDLEWVSSNAQVAALRDQHKADLVCLLVPQATVCGRGYTNYPLESSDANRGFCVVQGSCALDNFSFAHELGHNMGMRHDRETNNAYDSPTCNYGSVFNIKPVSFSNAYTARSVMTYPGACLDCPRFGLYSNPMTMTIGGFEIGPMGIDCNTPPIGGKYFRSNNRQQLIDAAPVVSRFR